VAAAVAVVDVELVSRPMHRREVRPRLIRHEVRSPTLVAVQDKDAAQRVILPPRADEARAIPPRPEDVAADRGKPARGSTATRWSA
jgi:hypothetical protein